MILFQFSCIVFKLLFVGHDAIVMVFRFNLRLALTLKSKLDSYCFKNLL